MVSRFERHILTGRPYGDEAILVQLEERTGARLRKPRAWRKKEEVLCPPSGPIDYKPSLTRALYLLKRRGCRQWHKCLKYGCYSSPLSPSPACCSAARATGYNVGRSFQASREVSEPASLHKFDPCTGWIVSWTLRLRLSSRPRHHVISLSYPC